MISKELFNQLIENQRELDAKIIEKMEIEPPTLERIELAYRIELAECINELKREIKYWSVKPMEPEKFIEEFVDALHFVLSYSYRYADVRHKSFMYQENESRIDYMHRVLITELDDIKRYEWVDGGSTIPQLALEATREHSITASFATLIYIAERFGYTEERILDAYKEKLRVNHERSDSGTY